MIERVAMAMWAENLKRGAGEFCAPWGLETDALREDWRAFAAAAINEMREPTEAMKEAAAFAETTTSYGGEDSFDYLSADNAAEVFRTMIDEALKLA